MNHGISSDIKALLKELKLPTMVEAYTLQSKDTKYSDVSFDERLFELLSKEIDARHNKAIGKITRQAKLEETNAFLSDINYKPERKLNRALIDDLSTNKYIDDHLNLILVGASGTGKTWLSCALGNNACLSRYKVRYVRYTELLIEFEAHISENKFKQYMKYLSSFDLLIIDDFLLNIPKDNEAIHFLEIIKSRTHKKSTIFCSQYSPEGWFKRLGSNPIADSILDRIRNSSYVMILEGTSLREDYSKLKKN